MSSGDRTEKLRRGLRASRLYLALALAFTLAAVGWLLVAVAEPATPRFAVPAGWQAVTLPPGFPHPGEAEGWYCTPDAEINATKLECIVAPDGEAVAGSVAEAEPSDATGGENWTAVVVAGSAAVAALAAAVQAVVAVRRREA
ncbi:hypothetical protein [Aquipuribacter sp. SD81]|uniref:hypothetical protein n=1 Tax=Aquipuribacter sp. SD81 TaxID=3127703 RepID=UPI00301745EB